MKRWMKIALISLIAMGLVLGVLLAFDVISFPPFNENRTSIRDAAELVNRYPPDLMLLGEDILFQIDIPIRKLDSLTAETVRRIEGRSYSVLVIEDRKDTVRLTEEEIELIRRLIYDEGYSLFYFGTKYLSAWNGPGYSVSDPDGLCVSFTNELGRVVRTVGFWKTQSETIMKNNPYILGDTLTYQLEALIRANH